MRGTCFKHRELSRGLDLGLRAEATKAQGWARCIAAVRLLHEPLFERRPGHVPRHARGRNGRTVQS
jgi:hypothetical protein